MDISVFETPSELDAHCLQKNKQFEHLKIQIHLLLVLSIYQISKTMELLVTIVVLMILDHAWNPYIAKNHRV